MAAAESSHVVAMGRCACILDAKRVLASNVKAARRVLEPSQEATAFKYENDRTPGRALDDHGAAQPTRTESLQLR